MTFWKYRLLHPVRWRFARPQNDRARGLQQQRHRPGGLMWQVVARTTIASGSLQVTDTVRHHGETSKPFLLEISQL
jgi:hypothetical protein